MSYGTFAFESRFHRRIPDPVHFKSLSLTRHVLLVSVADIPKGLPLDPNARLPNTSRRVYKDIRNSLLETDDSPRGTFHLKHKGITIVAERVRQKGDTQFEILINKGQGILDGGHTYELLTEEYDSPLPEDQFVKFEILTSVPEDWIPYLSGGLNTSIQVQPMSLDNLAGEFDWIKEELAGEPCAEEIAWRENEDGEFDARDLVSLMTCFNITAFPNDRDEHPVMAYEKKSSALKLFEEKPETYRSLRPILKDILHLHDTMIADAPELWNPVGSSGTGGKYGHLAYVDHREKKAHRLIFTGGETSSRLMDAALYPMLAAFRWNVETNRRGDACWRGGFDRTLELWNDVGQELLRATYQKSEEEGRNPNAIGKSRPHWSDLHRRVAMKDLTTRKS